MIVQRVEILMPRPASSSPASSQPVHSLDFEICPLRIDFLQRVLNRFIGVVTNPRNNCDFLRPAGGHSRGHSEDDAGAVARDCFEIIHR